MKKILSVILTSLMLISCFGINVFANELPDDLPSADVVKISRTNSGDYDIKNYKTGETILEDDLSDVVNSLSDGFGMYDFSNGISYSGYPNYKILADDGYIFISDDGESEYDGWYCDFSVSFDKNIAKNSMALFGSYSGFNVGFFAPIEVEKNVKIPLLNTVMTSPNWTYSNIKTNVKVFTCGAMNFSSLNNDTTMTVELRIFDPKQFKSPKEICNYKNWIDDVNTYVIEKIEYKLDKSTIIPEYEPEHDELYYAGTTNAERNYIPKGYYYLDGYFIKANENTQQNIPTAYYADKFVAQIGDEKYATLVDAIDHAPTDGTKTTITMIADETIEGNAGVTIPANKNIVLDLNGKKITNLVDTNDHSQVINNYGTLTIKDSTDSKCDGTGTGLLTNSVEPGTQAGDWWSNPQNNYTTNVIENNGTLTILSGKIEDTAKGSICYCVDNNAADGYDIKCYIKGGTLINSNYSVVRVAPSSSKTVEFDLTGGTIIGKYGIVYNGNNVSNPKLSFSISGGAIKAESYALYTGSKGLPSELNTTNFSYEITGGLFGTGNKSAIENELISIEKFGNFISGGWFTSPVKTEYIHQGYIASGDLTDKGAPNNTNVYTVVKDVPTENLENKETGKVTVDNKTIDTTFGTMVTKDETLPNIQVSNLNKAISTAEKKKAMNDAVIGANNGDKVEVEVIMNVELAKSGKIESLAEEIEKDKAGEYDPEDVEYIDITIDKIVKANGNVIEIKEIKETDTHQIFSFPIASIFETSPDKEKVFVYRNHKIDDENESNEAFTKVEKDYGPSYNIGDGECYWLDGDFIYIKAKKFSVYGFGVQNSEIVAKKKPTPTPDPTPSSDPKPRYKIPKTGVEGTTTNNRSLLKLSSLSLLAIGTYLVIKKKKDN